MATSILILGASGQTGSEMARILSLANFSVRVTYREQSELQRMRELGVDDAPADFEDVESLKKAMNGVERVFVIQPVSPKMADWTKNICEAAKSANISHLIRISNMATGPDLGSEIATLHHESDEMLKQAGCNFTIIKPANYYQNMFYSSLNIIRTSHFALPLGTANVAHIDVRDVARFGCHMLIDNGHENKEYIITGPEAPTMHVLARKFSKILRKEVRYIPVEPVAATQVFKDQGLPEWQAQSIGTMFTEYGSGKYNFVTKTFAEVTGEQPRSFDEFLADYRDVFTREANKPILPS
ncbi:MAG: NmrA family NAD(P)-binding protein [Betaproteobacteria bacterium]|nr:NmrA family NAD(P)-binding protein [Betaproteobacteria bacterium]